MFAGVPRMCISTIGTRKRARFATMHPPEESVSRVLDELRSRFRPEFLNRLDELVLFRHSFKAVVDAL